MTRTKSTQKWLVWSLSIVVLTPILIAAASVVLINTLDQRIILNQITATVKSKYQRTLGFTGPVQLKWFPTVGAELDGVFLSEADNTTPFIQAEKIKVSLAFMPLLSQKAVVDAVQVDGLKISVIKNKQGEFNFDSLIQAIKANAKPEDLTKDKSDQAQHLSLSIDSINLSRMQLAYTDQQTGTQALIKDLALETGKIQAGQPINMKASGLLNRSDSVTGKPNMELQFDLTTQLTQGTESNKTIRLANLALNAAGQMAGLGAIEVKVSSPVLSFSESIFKADQLTIGGKLNQSNQKTKRQTDLNIQGPFRLNLANNEVQLTDWNGQLQINDPQLPKQLVTLPINATVNANYNTQVVNLVLNSQYESSRFDLKTHIQHFSNPVVTASLNADKLDLDALLAPKKTDAGDAAGNSKGSTPSGDTPIDLTPLQNLNLDLTANVGELIVSKVKVSKFQTRATARNGLLTLDPLKANLYGGSTTGSLTANAGNQAVTLSQNMSNVQVQPLMKALLNKDMMEGKGNVVLDLRTRGKSLNAMKAALNGQVKISLLDGAVKGMNLAETLRNAKSLWTTGKNAKVKTDATQKTDFTSLQLGLNIVNGIASTNDLALMAPLFRIGGVGQINLVNNTVDYVAQAIIVATSTGQGGKTLDSGLAGLTIPVHLFGPFSAIQWELAFRDMVQQAAKDAAKEAYSKKLAPKVEEKKEELKEKARDKLKDALKGFMKEK